MNTTDTHRRTIAYDAKRAYLNHRGLGNYSRTLLAQMAHYYGDNRYVLCTPEDKGLYPWLNKAPFERVMPNGIWSMTPSIWRRYGIASALKEKHVDIYHGLSQELPEGIEKMGCKTVVTMHDAIFMRYPELYSATYRYSFIRRNRSACCRADMIIAISEQTKRDYIEFFGVEENRIRVVYQGCNALFWQPVSQAHRQQVKSRYHLPEQYVLTVGAIEARKNPIRTIQALASVHIDLPLVLVGNGNARYVGQVEEAARKYGVALYILPDVQTEDLPALYRSAAVFVYPSLFEGFGIPILEAARCEVPIIASSGTCFEEITGKGALYVSPTEVDSIGEALSLCLQDSAQTKERVVEALRQTEKFRDETIARNMMDVYQSLLC